MVENKKNFEHEELKPDNLDHWYGSAMSNAGIIRMVIVAISIIAMIYAGFKLSEMI